MEELLKQLLQAELDKVQKATPAPETPKAPETPAAPTFDMAALVEALKPAIEETVQKAMPAPQRGEGQGSRQEPSEPAKPENLMSELVQKARKPEELSSQEKNAIWSLTEAVLRQGLSDSGK